MTHSATSLPGPLNWIGGVSLPAGDGRTFRGVSSSGGWPFVEILDGAPDNVEAAGTKARDGGRPARVAKARRGGPALVNGPGLGDGPPFGGVPKVGLGKGFAALHVSSCLRTILCRHG